jgi:hypothetical protein
MDMVKIYVGIFLYLLVTGTNGNSGDCAQPPGARPEAVLAPLEESGRDKDLGRFLQQLRAALKRRDSSFGTGEDGLDMGNPKWPNPESPFWGELETILSLGGAFVPKDQDQLFCMPYLYSSFPPSLDPLEHQVIVKPTTTARVSLSGKSESVRLADYSIVKSDPGSATLVKDETGKHWARIYLNGKTLYVPPDCLRGPLDTRICFQKQGKEWRIQSITVGD